MEQRVGCDSMQHTALGSQRSADLQFPCTFIASSSHLLLVNITYNPLDISAFAAILSSFNTNLSIHNMFQLFSQFLESAIIGYRRSEPVINKLIHKLFEHKFEPNLKQFDIKTLFKLLDILNNTIYSTTMVYNPDF